MLASYPTLTALRKQWQAGGILAAQTLALPSCSAAVFRLDFPACPPAQPHPRNP